MSDDYDVLIDDLFEVLHSSRKEIITGINQKLGKSWSDEDHMNGVEVEIKEEWKKTLEEEPSIIYSYEELGWNVMQYKQSHNNGTTYEWFRFKNPKYKGKNK